MAYSARGLRFWSGMYQLASTTRKSGCSRWSSNQSVDTRASVVSIIYASSQWGTGRPFSCRNFGLNSLLW